MPNLLYGSISSGGCSSSLNSTTPNFSLYSSRLIPKSSAKSCKNSISKDDLSALYKKLEKNIKPLGINLSIYKNVKEIAEIRTYENGVGETLSCGSASLSVSSLLLKGKINKLRIRSFGGELKFVKSNESILMTGPTAFVYSGNINE